LQVEELPNQDKSIEHGENEIKNTLSMNSGMADIAF
jgi:hypothetical protein